MELLKQEAGIDMTHVPYKGAAPAVTGLLGGEIDVAMVDLLNVLPHVSSGTLRVLAVASPTRAPQIPDVPTTKEAGFAGVVMDTTYGVVAAQGVPADVQKKFREAVVDGSAVARGEGPAAQARCDRGDGDAAGVQGSDAGGIRQVAARRDQGKDHAGVVQPAKHLAKDPRCPKKHLSATPFARPSAATAARFPQFAPTISVPSR